TTRVSRPATRPPSASHADASGAPTASASSARLNAGSRIQDERNSSTSAAANRSLITSASCAAAEAVDGLVRDLAEHRQAGGLDDRLQSRAAVKLHVVAVDDDG